MPGTELGRRLVVAAVGIPLGIAVIYLGVWPVAALMSVVAGIGTREVYRMAESSGWRPFGWLGLPASAALVLSAAAVTGGAGEWSRTALTVVVGLALVALAAAVFRRGPEGAPLPSVAVTVLGVVYVGATLSFAVHLRAFPGVGADGMGWQGGLLLIFAMTVAWFGDTAAYFAGRWWGRAKLIPAVSPGKTVAGGIGGLCGAVIAAALFALLLLNPYSGATLPLLPAAGVGLVIGAVAQLGDLVESLLKREAGLKDSGVVFPGHGGVLDRFDSILLALPAAYLLLALFLDR